MFERNEQKFWRSDNFRECIKYLLIEFYQCVREGVLPHYFIPKFNLLSIKLTREAQIELLQLFDIIIQSDIGILKECKTLKHIWSEFLHIGENRNIVLSNTKRRNILKNAECMMTNLIRLDNFVVNPILKNGILTPREIISILPTVSCKTLLHDFVLKRCRLNMHLTSLVKRRSGNKYMYQMIQNVLKDKSDSHDISTFKLWCVILLFMQGKYPISLNIIYNVLSSIPPFAIYYNVGRFEIFGNKQLYVDMILDSDIPMTQMPKKAWMFDLWFLKEMAELVPLGIQIELYFCHSEMEVMLSPYVCTYYLQFLCYHEMRRYDDRDRALQHLIEAAFDRQQSGTARHSYNLAGHCLLIAGQKARAQFMFSMSDLGGKINPPYDKYNSAVWYLKNFF